MTELDDIKLCFDNTFSTFSEKKVHFEIFPGMSIGKNSKFPHFKSPFKNWISNSGTPTSKSIRLSKKSGKKTGMLITFMLRAIPSGTSFTKSILLQYNIIKIFIYYIKINKIHQCKFRSNDMRKKFRKSLRLLDQMRSQGHRDEALMENKGRSFSIIELFL